VGLEELGEEEERAEHRGRQQPSVAVSAPARSNRPGRRVVSRIAIGATTAMAMPIGTLTNNAHRQDATDVIRPPTIIPTADPEPTAVESRTIISWHVTITARVSRGLVVRAATTGGVEVDMGVPRSLRENGVQQVPRR
jgi:hypothetical protein